MTVTSTEFFTDWLVADGANKNWSYDFAITSAETIVIQVRDGLDGPIVSHDSNFMWMPIHQENGLVVFPQEGDALAIGKYVRLMRTMQYIQPVEIGNEGPFHPELHEKALDDLTMQVQQVANATERALKVPLGSDIDTSLLRDYLELVGVNIASVVSVADHIEVVEAVSDNISDVQAAAANLPAINAAPAAAESAESARDFTFLWANEDEDVLVDDGVHTGYSTWHWYQKVLAFASIIGSAVAGPIHVAAGKATPADADEFALVDSADGWSLKKLTWANIKTALAERFLPLHGGLLTGKLTIVESVAERAGLRLWPGVAPSEPFGGDVWFTATKLHVRGDGINRVLGDTGDLELITTTEAQAGVSNTMRAWSSLRVAQAIAEHALGEGQTWQDVSSSRSLGTVYQNTTGRTIAVAIGVTGNTTVGLEVSPTGTAGWVNIAYRNGFSTEAINGLVPPGHYYRANGTTLETWAELH